MDFRADDVLHLLASCKGILDLGNQMPFEQITFADSADAARVEAELVAELERRNALLEHESTCSDEDDDED